MADRARKEVTRLLDTLERHLRDGIPVIGLEPSCLLSMRDEIPLLVRDARADLLAENATLFEEFIAEEAPELALRPIAEKVLVHGHCHQKAHNCMGSVEQVLQMVPDLAVEMIDSGCCGMAGAFGYDRDTAEISGKMAEASLLPAVRQASEDTLLVADGTSCRHQIDIGSGRSAMHVARVLDKSLFG